MMIEIEGNNLVVLKLRLVIGFLVNKFEFLINEILDCVATL